MGAIRSRSASCDVRCDARFRLELSFILTSIAVRTILYKILNRPKNRPETSHSENTKLRHSTICNDSRVPKNCAELLFLSNFRKLNDVENKCSLRHILSFSLPSLCRRCRSWWKFNEFLTKITLHSFFVTRCTCDVAYCKLA